MYSWEDIVTEVAKMLNLKKDAVKKLRKNAVAKLVGLAPQMCETVDAKRFALSNVSLLVLASKCKTFDAVESDFKQYNSLTNRFFALVNFPGDVVKRQYIGKLLAINTLCDMEQDVVEDAKEGKFNPYAADADRMNKYKEVLIKEVVANPLADVDKVFSLEQASRGFWLG